MEEQATHACEPPSTHPTPPFAYSEEARDVVAAYEEKKGDMGAVIDSVMLATDVDETRFRDIINKEIKREETTEPQDAAEPTKIATKKKAKVCGLCGKSGHNKRTCKFIENNNS